ncbi:MAG: 50S ribosomal protein L18 [Thermaerobacterales bacterium]
MVSKTNARSQGRERRRSRVRKVLVGTQERPRLNVFRSHKHIYAQIIRDDTGHTLAAASSLDGSLRRELETTGDQDAARAVGKLLAERAMAKGIDKVAFDRGGFLFHGRVKSLAEGAREQGLEF